MTTDQQSKEAGYKSLSELSELSGFTVRTLQRISNEHPKRWKTILRGAKSDLIESEELEDE